MGIEMEIKKLISKYRNENFSINGKINECKDQSTHTLLVEKYNSNIQFARELEELINKINYNNYKSKH